MDSNNDWKKILQLKIDQLNKPIKFEINVVLQNKVIKEKSDWKNSKKNLKKTCQITTRQNLNYLLHNSEDWHNLFSPLDKRTGLLVKGTKNLKSRDIFDITNYPWITNIEVDLGGINDWKKGGNQPQNQ